MQMMNISTGSYEFLVYPVENIQTKTNKQIEKKCFLEKIREE